MQRPVIFVAPEGAPELFKRTVTALGEPLTPFFKDMDFLPAGQPIEGWALADEAKTIEVKGRELKVGLSPDTIALGRMLTPLGRAGTLDDAAGAVYLFCIPESDFMTGQVLHCSGGLIL